MSGLLTSLVRTPLARHALFIVALALPALAAIVVDWRVRRRVPRTRRSRGRANIA